MLDVITVLHLFLSLVVRICSSLCSWHFLTFFLDCVTFVALVHTLLFLYCDVCLKVPHKSSECEIPSLMWICSGRPSFTVATNVLSQAQITWFAAVIICDSFVCHAVCRTLIFASCLRSDNRYQSFETLASWLWNSYEFRSIRPSVPYACCSGALSFTKRKRAGCDEGVSSRDLKKVTKRFFKNLMARFRDLKTRDDTHAHAC